jgi:beta-phosphoglucomutase family hydrolase
MGRYNFDAVIFDLDGVVTKTALVHADAWKKMFDDYLKEREKRYQEPFIQFTHEHDYLSYVDGKPRYKGVASFLESRGIDIPFGDPNDPPGKETVCGLGNMKNRAFNQILKVNGAEVYDSTVALIHALKKAGIRVGVASSSKNCAAVLEATGLQDLFETRVDGVVSAELNIAGKPEPDIFTTACDNLGVTYDRAVVIEDAVSGVQAGAKGNFGLVLGVAREENEEKLKINGADIVVTDIQEIDIDGIERWFQEGLAEDKWSITYHNYDDKKEKTREALTSVGNGYFGTRGAMEEADANEVNYPGTYIAGVYNRLTSLVAGREIENEDFVNCPNWLPVNFKIGNDPWFDCNDTKIISFKKQLLFRTGVLSRTMIVRDQKGRETRIESKRIASMENPHLAALQYRILPINYAENITVRTGLNGNLTNEGVERYHQLNSKHLEPVAQGRNAHINYLVVKTNQSNIEIAEASKLLVSLDNTPIQPKMSVEAKEGSVYTSFDVELKAGNAVTVDKFVAIYTSRDSGVSHALESAENDIAHLQSFDEILQKSGKKWQETWQKIDIQLEGDRLAQKLIRLHLYHLMVSVSCHNVNIDAGITARGLHGEAYRGHIFWDELFVLPLYNIHFKDVAKSLLLYRYRRLDKAREYAKEHGYEGAMFPWQSGSDGREETQIVHLNPMTDKWGDDYSSLQRHVSLAIAFNIWQYYWMTSDLKFLEEYGAEMFLEICRFWASKANYDDQSQRYEINKVMGPDEFHEKYPDSQEGGLKDNTYTNIMVVWTLKKAVDMLNLVDKQSKDMILDKINLKDTELRKWQDISKKMRIVISDDNILAQYDGYFNLKELDWEAYRKRYGNISRMDRILKAEGKSADDYKVAKQADTLMTFYNLDAREVTNILRDLSYPMPDDYLQKNLKYYLHRTSHGSTLSRVVHARLANMVGDKQLSWELYKDALTSDYQDIQGGTTGEGIHCGVMAGTALIALTSYIGLNFSPDKLKIYPNLPVHWKKVNFNFHFQRNRYTFEVTPQYVKIMVDGSQEGPVDVVVCGKEYMLDRGAWKEISLKG